MKDKSCFFFCSAIVLITTGNGVAENTNRVILAELRAMQVVEWKNKKQKIKNLNTKKNFSGKWDEWVDDAIININRRCHSTTSMLC